MLVIYNDYSNLDWINHRGGLPVGTIIIINNETYNIDVISHLRGFGYIPQYSYKLCEDAPADKQNYLALDAENYHKDIKYSLCLGHEMHADVLFPEDLGGDKYAHYAEFIQGVQPRIVCCERFYNEWIPWKMLRFWIRNKPLRDVGITTVIGIWPESLPKICARIQWFFANLISRGNVMYYSELKTLPVL